MKYMMMMNAPRGDGGYGITKWAPGDFRAHIDFMMRFNAELQSAGEFVDAQGLAPPGDAKLVRAGRNGEPITDGSFADSREFLTGYWIVNVASAERAYALAAKVSAAPGPRGEPLNMPIELRRIMDAPPPAA